MRWRFSDPNNRAEAAERAAVTAKIDAWWRAFQAKTCDLAALFSQKAKWDLPGWMERNLQSIEPRLMWEFGPAVRTKGHRLVITPEAAHHLRPLADVLLKRAPAIEGWEFYGHRLPEGLETARPTVEGRTGRGIDDFQFQAACGEWNRIDLTFSAPSITEDDDQEALGAAFVAAECLIGEEKLDKWIGAIQIATATDNSNGLGLDRLKERVDALIGSVRDQLPPKPHFERMKKSGWTLWQFEPDEAEDYCEQRDMFVGKSMNPPLFTAARSNGVFCSERFSRCGETFCYVKIDGSEGLDGSEFSDKSEIEDALDAMLTKANLGCHIGGGMGLRYAYVDLALTDADKGVEAVRQRLRAGRVPKRSWIEFFDSDWAAEWVGIYDESPVLPMSFDD